VKFYHCIIKHRVRNNPSTNSEIKKEQSLFDLFVSDFEIKEYNKKEKEIGSFVFFEQKKKSQSSKKSKKKSKKK